MTLILERARRQEAPAEWIEADIEQDVFGYFASQVFSHFYKQQQDTLRTIAILPYATAPMAIALSGDPEAGRLLEEIYRRHLFTDRRGRDDYRYQFHSLFRQFLLAQLHVVGSVSDRGQLAAKAGALLEQCNLHEDAFTLYLEWGSWQAAREVILKHGYTLLAQGRWKTLEQWIRELPREMLESDPWLRYWLGAAKSQADLSGARDLLLHAYTMFCEAGDVLGQLLSAALVIESIYYEYDDFTPLDPWIERMDALLDAIEAFPDERTELAVYSAMLLATMVRRPGHRRLLSSVEKVEALFDRPMDVNRTLQSAVALLHYFSYAAQFDRAQPLIRRMAPLMSNAELSPLNRAWWYLFLGFHYHIRGDVRASVAAFEEADRISEEHGLRQTEYLSRIFRVYMYRCADDLTSSERWLDLAEPALNPARRMQVAQYHLAAQGNAILRQQGALAVHHARLAMASMHELGSHVHQTMWDLVGAIALIAGGEHGQANEWLDEAWQLSEGTYLEVFRPELLMIRAASALEQGDRAACREWMRQSLQLSKVGNGSYYYRWVLRFREPTLAEALDAGIEPEYVASLIRKFSFRPPTGASERWPWPVRVRTLGGFSIERDGEKLRFDHKAPRKPLALLAAIIAGGCEDVPIRWLLDMLWPDEEGDAALEALRITLHRLRKILGINEAVEWTPSGLTLNRNHCWVDASAFESEVRKSQPAGAPSGLVDYATSLYRGAFLPGEDAAWVLSMRERLRSKFIQHISRLGGALEDEGDFRRAAECYERGIEVDDLAEQLYQGLMRCHLAEGRSAEGMGVYRRLRQALSVTLGIQPSAATSRIVERLRAG